MKLNNRYKILTETGYQDFIGIQETIKEGINITLDNGTVINCTKEHRIKVSKNIFRKAENLKLNDKIRIKTDRISKSKIVSITSDKIEKYYDPINVNNGNTYSVDGITHHNCHIVIVDETAFIRTSVWEEFADSIFPAQSGLSFKKTVLISTANGKNHFYNIIKGARSKTNGYKNFEVPWEVVPRYKSSGEKKTPEEFKEEIVNKHGIVYFEQNYSCSFSGSSHTLISSDKLDELVHVQPEIILDGKLNVYKRPIKGHQYVMSIDAAKDGNDAFSVQIVDITNFNFEQVASASLQIDYLLMPEYINEWCCYYFNPYLIIENNEGAGQSIADQMYQTYEYENLHFDKINNKKKKYPGTRTTSRSRKQILKTLKTFIENNKLKLYDETTIAEFSTFILINNKYQADDGSHDDAVMSLALVFTIFNDSKNFDDMKKVVELIFQDSQDENIDITDLITIGSFDDGSFENNMVSNKEYTSYEEFIFDE